MKKVLGTLSKNLPYVGGAALFVLIFHTTIENIITLFIVIAVVFLGVGLFIVPREDVQENHHIMCYGPRRKRS